MNATHIVWQNIWKTWSDAWKPMIPYMDFEDTETVYDGQSWIYIHDATALHFLMYTRKVENSAFKISALFHTIFQI